MSDAIGQWLTEAVMEVLTGWRLRRAEAVRGPFPDCDCFRHHPAWGWACSVFAGLMLGAMATLITVCPFPLGLLAATLPGIFFGVALWSALQVSRCSVTFEPERVVVQGVFRRVVIPDGQLQSVGGWFLQAALSIRGVRRTVLVDMGMRRGTLMVAMLMDRRRRAGELWRGRRWGRMPDARPRPSPGPSAVPSPHDRVRAR
ncbi:MAG TPA: hypothetical protein VEB22_00750 [Phycisphaerales bacterium]|nr:hypothetical protein [Phycisphaerales bacterium]